MVKKIIFGQFMLVALAGCSNVSSLYKMDQQGTGRSSMPYTPQSFDFNSWRNHASLWENSIINMAIMTNIQAATYVSNGAQNANYTPQSCDVNLWFKNVDLWNNAIIKYAMAAMRNIQATYVSNGAQNANYTPQSCDVNLWFKNVDLWNNAIIKYDMAAMRNIQATYVSNGAQNANYIPQSFDFNSWCKNENLRNYTIMNYAMAAMRNIQATYVSNGAQNANYTPQSCDVNSWCNHENLWNNAMMNVAAMSNIQATYVSNVCQNANYTPQSFDFNSWCNHENLWNNAMMNVAAMSNIQATYVSNGAQNDHVSQNANYTPQDYNSFWNNVNAGISSSQATSTNNSVQFGNNAQWNNVNLNTGSISSRTAFASNTSETSLTAQGCNVNVNIKEPFKLVSSKNTYPFYMTGPNNSMGERVTILPSTRHIIEIKVPRTYKPGFVKKQVDIIQDGILRCIKAHTSTKFYGDCKIPDIENDLKKLNADILSQSSADLNTDVYAAMQSKFLEELAVNKKKQYKCIKLMEKLISEIEQRDNQLISYVQSHKRNPATEMHIAHDVDEWIDKMKDEIQELNLLSNKQYRS